MYEHFPALNAVVAENSLDQLGPPGSHQAADAHDLTAAHPDVYIAETQARQILCLQRNLARPALRPPVHLADLPPDHHGHQLVHVGLLHAHGAHIFSVPHDRHPVADPEDFLHSVGDVDHADPLGAQALHNGEQCVDLPLCQAGGGLIHDQDFRLDGQGLHHLNHLLLGDAQLLHHGVRRQFHAQAGQQGFAVLPHLLLVNLPGVGIFKRFPAQINVLGNVALRQHEEFLVDDADSQLPGVLDIADLHRLSLIKDLALVL